MLLSPSFQHYQGTLDFFGALSFGQLSQHLIKIQDNFLGENLGQKLQNLICCKLQFYVLS
jgi:hypothetical protein